METNMETPNEFQHTLETPIQRGDQTISSITLRKPSVQTLRGLSLGSLVQMDVDSISKLLPRISSPTLTASEIATLDLADLLALCAGISNFFLTRAHAGLSVDDYLADIAVAFGWPPIVYLAEWTLDGLIAWRERARVRVQPPDA